MSDKSSSTDREHRIARLAHLNNVLRTAREINRLVMQAHDRRGLLENVCRLLVDTRDYNNAFIVGVESGHPVEPFFCAGFEDDFGPMAASLHAGHLPICAGRAMGQSGIVVVTDPTVQCSNCPLAERYRGRAGVAVRLAHANRIFGWLSLSVPVEIAQDREEQQLIEEVAADISFGLNALEAGKRFESLVQKYAAVIATTTDAVVSTDPDGTIQLFNPGAEKLLACSEEEALATPIGRFFPPERENEPDALLRRLYEKGTVVNHATELLTFDGWRVPVEMTLDLRTDDQGRVFGINAIVRDITECRQAEAALAASEEKYRALYDNAPLSYQSLDEDGRFLDVNPTWLKILGYTREEVMGRSFAEFLHPDWKPHFAERFPEFKRRGAIHDVQFKLRHKGGHYLDVSFEGCVGYKPDGSFQQTYCVFKDITEQKRAEEALRAHQRQLATLMSNLPGMAYRCRNTPHWPMAFVSEGCLVLTGYAAKEISEDGPVIYGDLVHPYDREAVWREVQEALVNRRPFVLEYRIRDKSGEERWVWERGRAVDEDFDGTAIIEGFIADITERKRADKRLRRLMSAIEQTADSIVITEPDGTIQYVNPAFERITGYTVADAMGQNPRILKSGEHDAAFYRQLWQTLTSGETWEGSLTNRKKDGALYVEEASISPVFGDGGQIVNYVAVKRDITEDIKIAEKLNQAQKMEAIGSLAGGIAHDFNNILFPIVGLSEMLMEDLPEGSLEWDNAREILAAGRRGSELVKQILAFSRQAEERTMPVYLQKILKEVLKLCRATLPSDIELKLQIQQDCGAVMANPTQMHQIAMNLITNALHAIEPDHGDIVVGLKKTVLAEAPWPGSRLGAGAYAELSITDTGCGIAADILGKIFEPYFTTKEQGKGTGLGLAVVYGIVKEHGGDTRLTSEVGQGTSFQVFLPLLEKVMPEKTDPQPVFYPAGSERILVVDDEDAITRLETRMLASLGYRISPFNSSLEALEAFRAQPERFDLVITDMTMPKMTGDQLAREMIAVRPDIPIVLCTGFSERVNRERAEAAGIKGFLLKPVIKADLAGTVRKILDQAAAPA